MRTYLTWHNSVAGVPGLPANQTMIWLRTTGGSCEEDRQAFSALSTADKIAQSVAVVPASVSGWVLRSCGSQPSDDYLIPYTAEGDSFHPDDTTTYTPTGDSSDRSTERNQKIYFSNTTL